MDALLSLHRNIARAWADAAAELSGAAGARPAPRLAPTPRDVVATEGTASLLPVPSARRRPRRPRPARCRWSSSRR